MKNHFDSTFLRDDPVKWKNGKMCKYKDTRVAHARIQMRWKFGRTGRPRGSRRKAASVLELSEKEERKGGGSSFFSLPPLFLFFLSRSFPILPLRSIKIYSRTQRRKFSADLSGHLRKYPYFSTPRCAFSFVRARDKSQTCYSFPRNVNWGAVWSKFKLYLSI